MIKIILLFLFSNFSYAINLTETIIMHSGEGKLITLDNPLHSAFVSNPSVANISDVRSGSDKAFQVFAKEYGISDIQIIDEDSELVASYRIIVSPNTEKLNQDIKILFPDSKIITKYSGGMIVIDGKVEKNTDVEKIVELASGYVKDPEKMIVNNTIVLTIDELKKNIFKLFPTSKIEISYIKDTLVVSGYAENNLDAKLIIDLISTYSKNSDNSDEENTVINRIRTPDSDQVNLKVKVIEIETNSAKRLGIKWGASNTNGDFSMGLVGSGFTNILGNQINIADSGLNLNVVIDALSEKGVVKTLAEPNLTTISGKPAKFLAGGEYPYAIPDGNGGHTIEFKEYGIRLEFTPTILSKDNIVLNIKPEVSTLAEIAGANIPALRTRKADTTVELASGQSMAIAGFISTNSTKKLNEVPFLSSLPGIGAIFKSKDLASGSKELIIIVTPYLVNPTNSNTIEQPDEDLDYKDSGFAKFLNNDFFE
jgi:pilus assembly protein CpaC